MVPGSCYLRVLTVPWVPRRLVPYAPVSRTSQVSAWGSFWLRGAGWLKFAVASYSAA